MEIESFNRGDSLLRPAIIAMKGLPCTMKTGVAEQIGRWAKCAVLSIDDFIGDDDDEDIGGMSWEEAERLQAGVLQQTFTTLCRVARTQLHNVLKVVVIKSRLCSTYELEQLMQLVQGVGGSLLIIVECEMRNKHQWQCRFGDYKRKWYGPRSWNDIEKARDDHYRTQARADWDLHLHHCIKIYKDQLIVRRLVVDPYNDLDFTASRDQLGEPNPIFVLAINYLLAADYWKLNRPNPYVVEFDEFRRSRAEQFLNALIPSTRAKDVCSGGGCLFKYCEEVEGSRCGLCEERVVSGQASYTCHFCILTLHKSCVEAIDVDLYLHKSGKYDYIGQYFLESPGEKYTCKACTERGSVFMVYCRSCLFGTFLRRCLVPPVVKHDHHPHSLSLRVFKGFVCKACGFRGYSSSYVCRICEWHYHIQCISMPRELKHVHGGHEHVLRLKYTQDDMEQEDYWCDVCYKDLDPYFWFYSCQSCPYYAAHLCCAGVYPHLLWDRW